MKVKEQIQIDLKEAMKARAQEKVTCLRGVLAAIKQVEIDTRQDVSEEQVNAILRKEIKKRREALDFAKKAERQDLVLENEKELALIESYLGSQLSADELRTIIDTYKKEGLTSVGQIMSRLKTDHAGKYDSKLASDMAKG